jgi:ComF family protein
MARAMQRLEPLTAGVSLIPIPLGCKRRRDRGYNQSDCIATALGTYTGLPVRAELLRRARETPTQTALTPEERHANVAGAFQAAPVAGLRFVLIDDVFTTGATLAAAAGALIASGASRVEAVTFARASQELGAGS